MISTATETEVTPGTETTKTAMQASLDKQKAAFLSEGPPDAETRINRLDRLISLFIDNRNEIAATASADFGIRSIDTTLMIDVFGVVESIRYNKRNLKEWMQPEIHEAPYPDAVARVEFQPKGVVGVISPWNFPWTLGFGPIAGILAAGNRCMLKPSELTPKTSALMARLVGEVFAPEEFVVIEGGADTAVAFTSLPFDHIIFTGSSTVGVQVMRAAAENLTPITLELGGKSPTIIGRSADFADAVRRIMTIKTLNAGQICMAPDYAFIPAGTEEQFVEAAKEAVATMYGTLKDNLDYTSIINERHFDRLQSWINEARDKGAKIVEINPGNEDLSDRKFHRMLPTLIFNPTEDMSVLQQEIFGPLLPIITYRHMDEVITYVNGHPRPLALYYFGQDEVEERHVVNATTSGGVTINDCMSHAYPNDVPFGGIGNSGMGAYHGLTGFRTVSHARAVYRQSKSKQAEFMVRPPYKTRLHAFLDGAFAKD